MKYLNLIIILLFLCACEPLDLKRVMDTRTDVVEINGTSVVAYGTLLDVGSAAIVEHGHCWSTDPEPSAEDTTDNTTKLGTKDDAGEFSSNLFGLVPGLKHYVRSYVFDGAVYSYGEEKEFEITAEDLEFNSSEIEKLEEIGSILVTSSTIGLGSVNFIEHGHCWSQNDPPTIDDVNKTAFGSFASDTTFTSQINNLTMGVYYIRGYLESEGSVIYTNTLTYESTISVETGIISVNPNNTAVAAGRITSLGVKSIVDHGHCWSTVTSSPDINVDKSEHTSLGSTGNLGSFNSNIEGLVSGRTYYIRAYASDGSKFYYDDEIKSFVAN